MVDRFRGWLGTHPVLAFVLLTFGISYLVGGPVLIAGMMAIPPSAELLRGYLPRILVVYGPALAALILARCADVGGPAALLRRLVPSRTDVGVAVAVLLLCGAAAAISARVAGVSMTEMSRTVRAHAGLLAAHVVLQITVVAVGEELGWRGWLLPQLAARSSRLRAALTVGVIWGVWHGPLLLSGAATALEFLLFVIGISVLFTWLWAIARSGLFTVVIAHASVNAPMFFWEQVSAGSREGDERFQRTWHVLQAIYIAAALVLVLARWHWWTASGDRAIPDASADRQPATGSGR
jgi:membrane protease YdiL (CAAX protease family)